MGCLATVSVELIGFYGENLSSFLSTGSWQWHFWLMLEVTIPLAMAFSTALFLLLHYLLPETFIQTQWNLYLTQSYKHLGKMDYLNLHLEEIFLFNIHVSPFFINLLLYRFDPSTLKGRNSEYRTVVFDPIQTISLVNGTCYIVYSFMPLRKSRSHLDP